MLTQPSKSWVSMHRGAGRDGEHGHSITWSYSAGPSASGYCIRRTHISVDRYPYLLGWKLSAMLFYGKYTRLEDVAGPPLGGLTASRGAKRSMQLFTLSYYKDHIYDRPTPHIYCPPATMSTLLDRAAMHTPQSAATTLHSLDPQITSRTAS